jgi:CRP-like cAMP-binding protein
VIALTDGIVKVAQVDERGDYSTLTLRGGGEVLGEIGAVLGRPCSATVTAVVATAGHVVPAHAFRGYLERQQLATAIYQLAVDRWQGVERLRSELTGAKPRIRLARTLTVLGRQIGTRTDEGIRLELGMSREGLAAMAMMGRSSAMVILAELKQQGILALERRHITIADEARLRAAACRSQI